MDVDPVVLLSPLLVLAVVLLLGFAGCKFEPGTATPALYFRARVPTALVVTQIVFGWESPSTPRDQVVLEGDDLSPVVDGPDNVFGHSISLPLTEEGVPVSETWSVRCQVTVQGGATPGPVGTGMFTLDGSDTAPFATFQATGGAADLAITFVGIT